MNQKPVTTSISGFEACHQHTCLIFVDNISRPVCSCQMSDVREKQQRSNSQVAAREKPCLATRIIQNRCDTEQVRLSWWLDWFKGNVTGNHRFSRSIWGFPVPIFPTNPIQSSRIGVTSGEIKQCAQQQCGAWCLHSRAKKPCNGPPNLGKIWWF